MRGYNRFQAIQAIRRDSTKRLLKIQQKNVQAELAEEAAELKRARIMNRAEPGYERKDGKL